MGRRRGGGWAIERMVSDEWRAGQSDGPRQMCDSRSVGQSVNQSLVRYLSGRSRSIVQPADQIARPPSSPAPGEVVAAPGSAA